MDCTIYGADLHLVDAPKNWKFFKSVLTFGLGLTILSEQLKFHLLTIFIFNDKGLLGLYHLWCRYLFSGHS